MAGVDQLCLPGPQDQTRENKEGTNLDLHVQRLENWRVKIRDLWP